MMRTLLLASVVAMCGVALGGTDSALATTITKDPDLGAYWYGIDASNGSFVYADSFVAPVSGTVADLGMWLTGGGSQYRLEVLADNGADAPNGASILAQTAVEQGTYDQLTYVDFATTSSAVLIAGQTYWFAASAVGLGGSGTYVVGAHTQDSEGIVDNGEFYYGNDTMGLVFSGPNSPEIAFSVDVSPATTAVPEPASLALIGIGLAGFAAVRRRLAA